MYAYCNNNPVMYVDYSGELLGAIIGLSALTATLLISLVSSTDMSENYQEEAEQKYNEDTININGNNPNGIINVTIGPDGQTIHIENSHNISNSYEQNAILNTITSSAAYSSDCKDIEAMQIEWSGHNFGYLITKNQKINTTVSNLLGRKDANVNFKSVDISGIDSNQNWYIFVTLGGLIEW